MDQSNVLLIPEIVVNIASYLPTRDKLSLKKTNKFLSQVVSLSDEFITWTNRQLRREGFYNIARDGFDYSMKFQDRFSYTIYLRDLAYPREDFLIMFIEALFDGTAFSDIPFTAAFIIRVGPKNRTKHLTFHKGEKIEIVDA